MREKRRLERLRGRHDVVDEEPEDDSGEPTFAECAPEQRAKGCALCETAAAGAVPTDAVEAYRLDAHEMNGRIIYARARDVLDHLAGDLDDEMWLLATEG